MPSEGYTSEQIISKLREAEAELAKGATVTGVGKKPGTTDRTCHRWRRRLELSGYAA